MFEDVYIPCPCGSGKKLKFCCLDIAGEMAKVLKHQEARQYRQALGVLANLDQKHQHNAWVMTTRATLLLNEDRGDEAGETLKQLLEIHPDHLIAIGLYAAVAISTQSYEQARPAVYRAYQRCARAYPDLVSGVAMGIAAFMMGSGRFMSARQHLALAMKLATPEDRQNVFVRLVEIEGNADVPYPLRSVHVLAEYPTDDESLKQEVQRARILAEIGCWYHAARAFTELAEKQADNAALWQNAGLCHAWDGDEPAAAAALHRAAAATGDFPRAVELETIAQLLDNGLPENCVTLTFVRYPVKSVSRLLTLLDADRRLSRIEIPPPGNGEEHDHRPVAAYNVLDRALDPEADPSTLTRETVPKLLGQVSVYDVDDHCGTIARAEISGATGANFDAVREVVTAAGAEELEAATDEVQQPLSIARDYEPMESDWVWPAGTPNAARRKLEREERDRALHEIWPNLPLSALKGQSPRQAAGVPDLKVPVAAACYVLDAICEQQHNSLDLPAVAARLGIELPGAINPADVASLQAFSSMQLHRLPVKELNDRQLRSVMNRALLVRHSRFLYEVLAEVLNRPACREKVDINRVHLTLTDLCSEQDRLDEALDWADKGKQAIVKGSKDAFEQTLTWDMRELLLRLRKPNDPQLKVHVRHVRDYYGPKLPHFEEQLFDLLESYGVETAQMRAEPTAGDSGAQAGGIWTPGAGQPAEAGASKLWLPGQD